jgi:hypothetical protein
MLIGGCVGSINSRFASGGKTSFFFQPVQLHLELSDLLIQLGLQRLLILLLLRPSCRENFSHLLVQAMFPMRNLRRMHPVCTGSFVDSFESFERFERHSGFELRAVLFPLCRHRPSPLLIDTAFYLNHLSSFRGTLYFAVRWPAK